MNFIKAFVLILLLCLPASPAFSLCYGKELATWWRPRSGDLGILYRVGISYLIFELNNRPLKPKAIKAKDATVVIFDGKGWCTDDRYEVE